MITKKFSKSFDDALTQAYLFHSEFVADQAVFEDFSSNFASPYADDFLDLITIADEIPTNQDDLDTQTSITNDLDLKMDVCKPAFQKLMLHVGFAWPNDDAKLKAFGKNQYEDARRVPAKMVNLLQDAYRDSNSTAYKATLIAVGFLQTDITQLNTLATELKDQLSVQQSFIKHSSTRADERVKAFNDVWDVMVQISNAAKLIFVDSPGKIEFYLLYPEGAGPGPLTAPTGLSFYFPSTTFSWNEVANASSYRLMASVNNIDWIEVYAGEFTECVYVPEQPGTMFYKVQARSSIGFGDFSTVLSQGYYPGTVLPAPENLTLQLAAGSPNTLELKWTPVSSATTYSVNKSSVPLGSPVGPFAFVTNTHDPEYVETVLPGHRYYYNLTASNSYQWSGVSVNVFLDVVE